MLFDVGSGYGIPTSNVPVSAFSTAYSATDVSPMFTTGSVGKLVSGRRGQVQRAGEVAGHAAPPGLQVRHLDDRFSCIRTTTCSTSLRLPAPLADAGQRGRTQRPRRSGDQLPAALTGSSGEGKSPRYRGADDSAEGFTLPART
ncbi:hypothetical protein ABH935_005179 [Catenulispora sp. GAS73]|uniref:hypothetical protein n=1 Tax=Catenulispora sp. GAS73 TaxID=3156269 RepID=UPI0035196C52